MIKVEFRRIDCTIKCHSCSGLIEKTAPVFILNINENNPLVMCEDCGNGLQNDISIEYSKFVDLEE